MRVVTRFGLVSVPLLLVAATAWRGLADPVADLGSAGPPRAAETETLRVLSEPLVIREYRVLDDVVSDHRAVLAEIDADL